ncbi:MAG: murein biosynthesis integral membrane protein MurJ [Oscillospiraceae bacterium]|jgi:putative peptidoglycan lipid II flippase|nr:murein biosynthesis integral membrane protein MurJ [Oscillospiraceae bacterium]
MKNTQPLVASAALVAAATVALRLLGFLREMTLARTYGAGAISDAFTVAYSVPGIVLMLVGSSVASAFIPMFARLGDGRRKFTDNIITMMLLIGLVFSAVFTVVPQALTFLFASQFEKESFDMASALLRIMVWSAAPLLAAGVLQAFLQMRKAFFLSAIANIPLNVAAIIFIYLSGRASAPLLMGAGVIAGHAVTVTVFFMAARRHEYAYRPYLNPRAPELKTMLVLLAPVMLSTFIGEINQIVDRNFASSLVAGSVSCLNYANRVVSVMTGLVGASAATVLFPKMSELAAQNEVRVIKEYFNKTVRLLAPTLLPAVLGLILLAEPVTALLFERGMFTPEDTVMTAQCLRMYAPLLFTTSIGTIAVRAMFSMKDTKTPAIIAGAAVVLSVGLNLLLIGNLKHVGLSLATSSASVLSLLLLLLALRKKLGPLGLWALLPEWLKTVAAAAAMGAAVYAASRKLPLAGGATLRSAALIAAVVFAGAAVYAAAHFLLRTRYTKEVIAITRGLLRRGKVS